MKKRWFIAVSITMTVIFLLLTVWCNSMIERGSQPYLFNKLDSVKPQKVGLLLGTSRYLQSGKPNEFFANRINAAVELFQGKKIKYIIVSGDNSRLDYNEPLDMKNALMERGIPESCIFLDYAGLRTFDSVIRAKEIFGQNRFIIISQKFHNERAVYIARENGIEAYGFNAADVTAYNGFKTKVREFFARDKVFVDNLTGMTPRHMGAKIKIQ